MHAFKALPWTSQLSAHVGPLSSVSCCGSTEASTSNQVAVSRIWGPDTGQISSQCLGGTDLVLKRASASYCSRSASGRKLRRSLRCSADDGNGAAVPKAALEKLDGPLRRGLEDNPAPPSMPPKAQGKSTDDVARITALEQLDRQLNNLANDMSVRQERQRFLEDLAGKSGRGLPVEVQKKRGTWIRGGTELPELTGGFLTFVAVSLLGLTLLANALTYKFLPGSSREEVLRRLGKSEEEITRTLRANSTITRAPNPFR